MWTSIIERSMNNTALLVQSSYDHIEVALNQEDVDVHILGSVLYAIECQYKVHRIIAYRISKTGRCANGSHIIVHALSGPQDVPVAFYVTLWCSKKYYEDPINTVFSHGRCMWYLNNMKTRDDYCWVGFVVPSISIDCVAESEEEALGDNLLKGLEFISNTLEESYNLRSKNIKWIQCQSILYGIERTVSKEHINLVDDYRCIAPMCTSELILDFGENYQLYLNTKCTFYVNQRKAWDRLTIGLFDHGWVSEAGRIRGLSLFKKRYSMDTYEEPRVQTTYNKAEDESPRQMGIKDKVSAIAEILNDSMVPVAEVDWKWSAVDVGEDFSYFPCAMVEWLKRAYSVKEEKLFKIELPTAEGYQRVYMIHAKTMRGDPVAYLVNAYSCIEDPGVMAWTSLASGRCWCYSDKKKDEDGNMRYWVAIVIPSTSRGTCEVFHSLIDKSLMEDTCTYIYRVLSAHTPMRMNPCCVIQHDFVRYKMMRYIGDEPIDLDMSECDIWGVDRGFRETEPLIQFGDDYTVYLSTQAGYKVLPESSDKSRVSLFDIGWLPMCLPPDTNVPTEEDANYAYENDRVVTSLIVEETSTGLGSALDALASI